MAISKLTLHLIIKYSQLIYGLWGFQTIQIQRFKTVGIMKSDIGIAVYTLRME